MLKCFFMIKMYTFGQKCYYHVTMEWVDRFEAETTATVAAGFVS